MKAVAYSRVSAHGEDISNQVKVINEWAKQHGYEMVRAFKDEAVSGAGGPLEREVFNSLLKYCISV